MKLHKAVALLIASSIPILTSGAEDVLPWDELSSSLSSSNILTTPTIDAYVSECATTFLSDPTMIGTAPPSNTLSTGSNWMLLDQPGKLCVNTLTCTYDDCVLPDPNLIGNVETFVPNMALFEDPVTTMGEAGSLAFPARVVHPTSVGDVATSLKWASGYGVPVTVKTTGHHFTGASTMEGTLNINTRSIPAYAKGGISECEDEAIDAGDASLVGRACRLALVRGKSAIIRVGGGEVWDAVLQSVLEYNEANENKYMALSGNAGSVSGAGGWLASGGNSAVRGSRLYGLGVDQVLQMEMVLPDGTHVRFGPDEWEDAPDFLYPKTTQVKGFCNENVAAANEEELDWKECDVIDFNELWMASRGGGGGTWGIVTSLVYQLHPRPGHHTMKFLPLVSDADAWKGVLGNETMVGAIDDAIEDFKLEFYLNPSALGVAEEDSNACGCDFTTYPHFSLPPWGMDDLLLREAECMGEDAAEAWAMAWKTFLSDGRGKDRLLAGGFSEEQIKEMGGWAYGSEWKENAAAFEGQLLNLSDEDNASYGLVGLDHMAAIESLLVVEDPTKRSLELSPIPGHLPDMPNPTIMSGPRYFGSTTSLISTESVLKHRDTLVPLLARWNRSGEPWYVYGGAILNGHDQMTAIPKNRREGGLYVHFELILNADIFETVLPIIMEGLDPSADAFPGFVGHNHSVRHGPLKEDWNKPCPITLTRDEMDKLCVSEQEAVWGTELLARLEKFKAEIDPDMIMTCSTGVGFKRVAAKEEEDAAAEQPDNTTLVVGDDAPAQAPGGGEVSVGNGPAPAPGGGDETKSAGSYIIKSSVFVLIVAVSILI